MTDPKAEFFELKRVAALCVCALAVTIGGAYTTEDPVTSQRWVLAMLSIVGVMAGLGLGVFFSRRHVVQLEEAVEQVRTQLGQYSLGARIGQGGMGDVYRASHVLMRRDVAIKLVRGDKLSAEYVARFEREVQLTSMLNHPNTIQVYDYGSASDGTFYYVMELLNGVSMAKFIDIAGAIDAGRCIHLVRQLCESLREAHRAGLVHRDVKPGNIHVCERGGVYDVIKVLDFGLVKDVKSVDADTELTGDIAFGTPGFVAPEAIRDSRKATAVSDIYAVGAVAYALLAARPIFDESNKVKLLLRQLNEDPTRPSEHRAQPIPSDLEDLVMAMIQRDPDRRPRSMDDVLDQLDACAQAGSWTSREARRWWANRQKYFITRPKAEPTTAPNSPASSATVSVDLETRIH